MTGSNQNYKNSNYMIFYPQKKRANFTLDPNSLDKLGVNVSVKG